MRAALAEWWPVLADVFGLYPDDVPRFSFEEWTRYLDYLRDRRG